MLKNFMKKKSVQYVEKFHEKNNEKKSAQYVERFHEKSHCIVC